MCNRPKYFQLNPDLRLRGWHDITKALQNSFGKVAILPQATFDAIELAWNGIPADSSVLLPAQKDALKFLVDQKMGIFDDKHIDPLPIQKYKKADCNFVLSIHWSITGRCNMKCRHCFVEAPDALYGELSLAECLDIMDQMQEANITSVSLTGGEPLVRSDWEEFYLALKERGISVSCIYTNGLMVTKEWLDKFAKIESDKIGFSLSFDGIGHHDWLRGREGMEPRTIEAIKLLVERGYNVDIETALFKDNIESMPDTCELLANLGVKAWKISEMSNSGAWLQYADKHSASQNEINQCYIETIERFQKLGRPFSLQMDHRYVYMKNIDKAKSTAMHGDGSEESLKHPACSCARLHPYLLPNGILMPCMPLANCGMDTQMPILKETRLVDVLKNDTSFFNFISITPEEVFKKDDNQCADCEYKLQCCGGCRARSYSNGNLYGPDPAMCDFFKKGTNKLFERFYY